VDLPQKFILLFARRYLEAILDAKLCLLKPVKLVLDVRQVPPAIGALRT
jgi:hypothetical protein